MLEKAVFEFVEAKSAIFFLKEGDGLAERLRFTTHRRRTSKSGGVIQ